MANFINDVHIINPQVASFNGNVDDFLIESSLLRATPSVPMNLSGITMGGNSVSDGAILFLINASTNPLNVITLLNESLLSEVQNRIFTPTGLSVAVSSLASVRLIYSIVPGRQGWWVA